MTTGGLLIMLLSVGFVTVLFVYCIIRVMRATPADDSIHGYEGEVPDPRRDD